MDNTINENPDVLGFLTRHLAESSSVPFSESRDRLVRLHDTLLQEAAARAAKAEEKPTEGLGAPLTFILPSDKKLPMMARPSLPSGLSAHSM